MEPMNTECSSIKTEFSPHEKALTIQKINDEELTRIVNMDSTPYPTFRLILNAPNNAPASACLENGKDTWITWKTKTLDNNECFIKSVLGMGVHGKVRTVDQLHNANRLQKRIMDMIDTEITEIHRNKYYTKVLENVLTIQNALSQFCELTRVDPSTVREDAGEDVAIIDRLIGEFQEKYAFFLF